MIRRGVLILTRLAEGVNDRTSFGGSEVATTSPVERPPVGRNRPGASLIRPER